MSTEAAIAFVERLRTDEAFLSKIGNAANRGDRLALAREEGFDLSADDVGAVKGALGIEELLTDEDLEKVAGGTGTATSVVSSATYSVISAGAVVAGAAAAL